MTENNPPITKETDKSQEEQEDQVDPWNVASSSETGVNYDKLIG